MTQILSFLGMTQTSSAAAGSLLVEKQPLQTWSAEGRLISLRNVQGDERRYVYDSAGHLAQVQTPDGAQRDFAYDASGRLVSDRQPGHRPVSYHYNENGQVVQINQGGQGTTLGYDESGRLVRIADEQCVVCYRYDERDRLIEQSVDSDGQRTVTTYAYDEKDRCIGLRPPGSSGWLRYEYDPSGRLTVIRRENGQRFLEHSYENDCARTRFGNGVQAETVLGGTSGLRRMRAWLPGDSRAWFDHELASDAHGNITHAGGLRCLYDEAGQLILARGPGETYRYRYDRSGNRIASHTSQGSQRRRVIYHFDCMDRMVSSSTEAGKTRFLYQQNGEMALREGPDGRTIYRYDPSGRLVCVIRNGQILARFGYDSRGFRRWVEAAGQRIIEHRDPQGALLAQSAPAGRVLVTYVRAGGRVIARVSGALENGETSYYHTDYLGSTRVVTGEQGQVLWHGGYGPYGEGGGPAEGICVGFAGYEWQSECRLYYAGARWYDPELGRFLTADSYTCGPDDPRVMSGQANEQTLRAWLADPRRVNRYAYCLNNPVTYVDLDGHDAGGVFLTIIGFIWALPATVFGISLWLTLEILCILPLILSLTGVFQPLGVAVHGSGQLETFGLFFSGGMIGSFMSAVSGGAWKGITSGYTVFLQASEASNQSTICHELRHTNQYGWFGPFFALPTILSWAINLPALGLDLIFHFLKDDKLRLILLTTSAAFLVTVYFWDWVVNGYANAWSEKDAQQFESGC